jgi:hypothetical protein
MGVSGTLTQSNILLQRHGMAYLVLKGFGSGFCPSLRDGVLALSFGYFFFGVHGLR